LKTPFLGEGEFVTFPSKMFLATNISRKKGKYSKTEIFFKYNYIKKLEPMNEKEEVKEISKSPQTIDIAKYKRIMKNRELLEKY